MKFITFAAFLASVSFSLAAESKPASITLSSKGDEMLFDKAKLSCKSGQKVKLTLKNASKKNSGLQHNWVLVKPGTDAAIATAGISAGADKGWTPDSPDILAKTKLLDSGQTDAIEFTCPPAGEYPYLCTFPGHAAMMKGVLQAK
jgi:azurin